MGRICRVGLCFCQAGVVSQFPLWGLCGSAREFCTEEVRLLQASERSVARSEADGDGGELPDRRICLFLNVGFEDEKECDIVLCAWHTVCGGTDGV